MPPNRVARRSHGTKLRFSDVSTYLPLTILMGQFPRCLSDLIYASDRFYAESWQKCAYAAMHHSALQGVIRKPMKLIFVSVASWVGCVWWESNVSYAEQPSLHEWGRIVGPEPLACRSHNDWKRMNALLTDDAAAAMEFGHKFCIKFEEMTIVRVENITSDALCVRPMGGYDCFWILPQWVHGLDDN